MKKSIAITGSNGTIGRILKGGLSEFEITGFDLPQYDLVDFAPLPNLLKGHDVVIHLAWNTKVYAERQGATTHENALLFENVYKAAHKAGVPRVIMASSVHADDFYNWKGPDLMSVDSTPVPDSPYGAQKVYMEALGRYYSKKGVEVICIRFGGISVDNKPGVYHPSEQAVFLSHNDLISLIAKCISVEPVNDNFALIYAVSSNDARMHDTVNPFGWEPREKAEDFIG